MNFVENVGPYANTRDGNKGWGRAWTAKHCPDDSDAHLRLKTIALRHTPALMDCPPNCSLCQAESLELTLGYNYQSRDSCFMSPRVDKIKRIQRSILSLLIQLPLLIR